MMEWMKHGLGVLFIVLMAKHLAGDENQAQQPSIFYQPSGLSDTIIMRNFLFQKEQFRDTEAQACQNFYQYVCGRASNFDHPPTVMEKSEWKKFIAKELKEIIEETITIDDEPLIVKVKLQYQMCMDNGSRNSEGIAPLTNMLTEYVSEWPMMMDNLGWNARSLKLLESQKYHQSLFSIRVEDFKIYIDRYDISAYGRYLSNLKFVPKLEDRVKYKRKIKNMLISAGLKPKSYTPIFDMDFTNVMNFREDLHKIAAFESERDARKIQYSKMTVEELQKSFNADQTETLVGKIKWLSFLRYVFKEVRNFEINESTIVHVEENYMRNLIQLMKEYDARTLANHIVLHFFETYAGETTDEMRKISRMAAKAARATTEPEEVNSCFNQPHMLQAANYLYLKRWFPENSRNEAQTMIMNIKQALLNQIKTSAIFFDDSQRKEVEGEVHEASVIIGSKPKYSEYSILEPLYQYEVPTNHLGSLINAQRAFKRYEYSTIVKSKNLILDSIPVLRSDLTFSIRNNRIELPMGYLQRASLSPTLPKTYSYAILGQEISLILNEIIIRRGFESFEFDLNKTWYNRKITKEFRTRSQCLETQYDAKDFQDPSDRMPLWKINGNVALEHNIYDNAAFATTYSAYSNSNKKPESSDMVFLINWANKFCGYWYNSTEDQVQRWFNRLSPISMRINKIMSNSGVFQDVCRCPSGSPMGGVQCKFWN